MDLICGDKKLICILLIAVLLLAIPIQLARAEEFVVKGWLLSPHVLPPPPPQVEHQGKVRLLSQVGGAVIDVALDGQLAYIGKGQRLLGLSLTEKEQFELGGSSINLPDIVQAVAVSENIAYVADGGGGLRILDVSASEYKELGNYATWASGVAVIEREKSKIAILTDGDVRILDVTDPAQPLELNRIATKGFANSVALYEQYAFIADGEGGGILLDLQDPKQPVVLSQFNVQGYAYGGSIAKLGERLIVIVACGKEGGIQVIDASDAAKPRNIGGLKVDGSPHDVLVEGSTAFVAAGEGGVQVISLSNPEKPLLQSQSAVSGYALNIALKDNNLFVADGDSLLAIDSTDKVNLKKKASYEVLGSAYDVVLTRQAVQGSERTYAYVADYYSGMLVFDVSQAQLRPTLTGFYDDQASVKGLSLFSLKDQAENESGVPLISQKAKTYALLNTAQGGLVVLDATSPYYPLRISQVEGGAIAQAQAIQSLAVPQAADKEREQPQEKLLVYAVDSAAASLRIFDLSQPKNPEEIGSYTQLTSPRGVFVFTADLSPAVFSVLNSTIKPSVLAAVADGTAGVQLLDVTDPQHIALVSRIDTPGFAESVWVEGKALFVADGQNGGLRVFDLQEPRSPKEISAVTLAGTANGMVVAENKLYLANGEDGLRIFDVSDPSQPLEIGAYRQAGFTSGVAVQGDIIYCANRAAGLLVLQFQAAQAYKFTVNTTEDEGDAVYGDGRCASIKGHCSLRAALQETNANPGLDTIILPKGLYRLMLAGKDEDKAAQGDLDITDHLIIKGEGIGQTVLDGNGIDRVIHILGDGKTWVGISGVTIQNGLAGVNVNQAELHLSDSEISGNQGYGCWAYQSKVVLDQVLIQENDDPIYVGGVGGSLSEVWIENSGIVHNEGNSGGISLTGELTLLNSTVAENIGKSGTGGIELKGKANIVFSTIYNNSGLSGGGIVVEKGSLVRIKASLLLQNTVNRKPSDCSGGLISLGYNVLSSPLGCMMEKKNADIIGADAAKLGEWKISSEDIKIPAFMPLPNSKIIDRVPLENCTDIEGNPVSKDQFGHTRPNNQNGKCESGAVEFIAP